MFGMVRPALLVLFTTAFGTVVAAELTVAALFTDHAVLQRDQSVPVWGTAAPGRSVSVEFAGQTRTAKADHDGRWKIVLDPMSASDVSRDMEIRCLGANIQVTDVVIGEVWLAAGTANLSLKMGNTKQVEQEISKAVDPMLRFFRIPAKSAAEPQRKINATWDVTTPKSARNYSAAAYFFARDLRRSLDCPIGVLTTTWSGTSIQSWMSLDGLKTDPPLGKLLSRWDAAVVLHEKIMNDPVVVGAHDQEWKEWKKTIAPAYEEALKNYNDAKAAGNPVGEKPKPSQPEPINPDPMSAPNPSSWPTTPTVVYNGTIAPLIPYALKGIIWYQGETNLRDAVEYRTLMPRLIADWRGRWKAQGQVKGNDEPTFLLVQLPCAGSDSQATDDWPGLREAQLMTLAVPRTGLAVTIDMDGPITRRPMGMEPIGQRLALLARKLAYGQDVVASGPQVQEVAIEPGGKIRVSFSNIGAGLIIGHPSLRIPGVDPYPTDKLIGFVIAGDDKKWVEANAMISGANVILSSPTVPTPTAVRYGWATVPRCNLANQDGLPASPFRSDTE